MPSNTQTAAPGRESPPAWQPVPSMADGRFLILERRGDPCSSNTALIHLPRALLIVDPGSAPDQAAQVSRLAAEIVGGTDLPVLILLTHAHWDHFAALPLLVFPGQTRVHILAHAGVEDTLEHDARLASMAFLFNAECPPIRVDIRLLSGDTPGLDGPPGAALRVVPGNVRLRSMRRLPCESIRVSGTEVAQVFHTPGHSPDSLCIRVGGMLWVGDLLLAANPAVAGIPGWDGRSLVTSLQTVAELLDTLPFELCCPGHGRILAIPKVRQILAGVQTQAVALREVATLDPERVRLLIECAEELLREGLTLFTIIAGRLYTLSYHLDSLEESQTAAEVLQAMDIEGLDAVLGELGDFAGQFRAGRRLEVALPLKGIQTVGRIEQLFDSTRLRGLIDPILLRRARRLLDDFVHTVRGIEPPSNPVAQDLQRILDGLAGRFMPRATSASALWDASGDETAFRQALTRHLATSASAVRLTVDMDSVPPLPGITVDRDRVEEALHAILSEFAGAGTQRVTLTADLAHDGTCRIGIRPVPDRRLPCFTPPLLRFLDRCLRPGGGGLADTSTPAATTLTLIFGTEPPG